MVDTITEMLVKKVKSQAITFMNNLVNTVRMNDLMRSLLIRS